MPDLFLAPITFQYMSDRLCKGRYCKAFLLSELLILSAKCRSRFVNKTHCTLRQPDNQAQSFLFRNYFEIALGNILRRFPPDGADHSSGSSFGWACRWEVESRTWTRRFIHWAAHQEHTGPCTGLSETTKYLASSLLKS